MKDNDHALVFLVTFGALYSHSLSHYTIRKASALAASRALIREQPLLINVARVLHSFQLETNCHLEIHKPHANNLNVAI